jgi:hypothetical protein
MPDSCWTATRGLPGASGRHDITDPSRTHLRRTWVSVRAAGGGLPSGKFQTLTPRSVAEDRAVPAPVASGVRTSREARLRHHPGVDSHDTLRQRGQ